MYRFVENQLNISNFGQPVGMKMNPENRWVKKAELILWNEVEKKYAALFKQKQKAIWQA